SWGPIIIHLLPLLLLVQSDMTLGLFLPWGRRYVFELHGGVVSGLAFCIGDYII
ncbi:hypothetical protein JOL62DRAFT_564729, partial [Phyllosticta paracitricarpa]